MISDTPEVEIGIFCDGSDHEYFITGYNGRFDWELIQQFEESLSDDTPKELIAILSQITIDYGAVTVFAQLTKYEPEIQYGTGYGDVLTIPGYYHINKLELLGYRSLEREEVSHG